MRKDGISHSLTQVAPRSATALQQIVSRSLLPVDKITHAAIAMSVTFALHCLGLGTVPVLGSVTVAIAAKEVRDGNANSRVEHQQDIVAGLSGMLAAEAIWVNGMERHDRRVRCEMAVNCAMLEKLQKWQDSVAKAQKKQPPGIFQVTSDTTRRVP